MGAPSNSAFPIGLVIKERYRIVRRLGAGGAGEVFEVAHLHLPTRLALKVLRADKPLTPKAMMRFRREARILAELEHPNIVKVLDFDFFEGRPFFVMEFVEGRELAALIEPERGLARGSMLSIVGQLCSALSTVHARGIVHRDLKPQNILVSGDSERELVTKIVDFGLSRGTDSGTLLTASQAVVGTPLYMSPEQAEGRNDEIDGRTDQFSLGAICYELLTGRAAFRADSLAGTVLKVVNDEPPPMSAGDVSSSLEAVVRRAMDKTIERRYPSISDFWTAFSESWNAAPPAVTLTSRAAKRGWILAGALALCGAGALAARAIRPRTSAPPASSRPADLAPAVSPPAPPPQPDRPARAPEPTLVSPAKKHPALLKKKAPRLFEHL